MKRGRALNMNRPSYLRARALADRVITETLKRDPDRVVRAITFVVEKLPPRRSASRACVRSPSPPSNPRPDREPGRTGTFRRGTHPMMRKTVVVLALSAGVILSRLGLSLNLPSSMGLGACRWCPWRPVRQRDQFDPHGSERQRTGGRLGA